MLEARDIRVTGIVQGVGFRPFVYRLARRYLVNGWVLNGTEGVFIHAEGDEALLDEFILEISQNPPAAARVDQIDIDYVPLQDCDQFEIRFSQAASVETTTLVSPDLATCEDCVRELFDPADRRYHYPFINCTNCGPRFTIIDDLPYDRASTSMRTFPMCSACAEEYDNPADRRFHAQPNACFDCGPLLSFAVLANGEHADAAESPSTPSSRLSGTLRVQGTLGAGAREPGVLGLSSLTSLGEPTPEAAGFSPASASAETNVHMHVAWGTTRQESDALIERVVEMLRAGKIVAVKGLGGFHLVCDASNVATLAELRRRKKREGKAFAVMVRDVEQAHRYCFVSEEEETLLTSAARPIVLLRKKPGVKIAKGLADNLPELGIMLPATPVQHLLLRAFDGMLVMTSGNVHDEPIQTDEDEAYVALAGIADAFLGNNRPIRSRYDDSVVRVLKVGGGDTIVQVIRRARGYAPLPLGFAVLSHNENTDPSTACASQYIFATGPEQKCTLCLTRPGGNGQAAEAFVSQHIGDMETVETNDAWLAAKTTYEHLLQIKPNLVACDMHPEYLTSKWAHAQNLPVIEVQHHHAHIVSAMAEQRLEGPVLGFAFDGTGFGPDGALWGGEALLANLSTYERFANFAYFPLPGGAAAIKHPLRCAYGALWAFDLLDHPAAIGVLEALGQQAEVCNQMIDAHLNTPYTSSVGRLFDAASAILGLCSQPTYEGEPAILLEAAMNQSEELDGSAIENSTELSSAAYSIDIIKNTASKDSTALDTSVVLFDAAPAFQSLLDDVQAGVPIAEISRRFHDAFVLAIVTCAQLVEAAYDIYTVVLAGGVFMNRYLTEHAVCALVDAGFTVAMNKDLPPNDGGVSFGQAIVAQHQQ